MRLRRVLVSATAGVAVASLAVALNRSPNNESWRLRTEFRRT